MTSHSSKSIGSAVLGVLFAVGLSSCGGGDESDSGSDAGMGAVARAAKKVQESVEEMASSEPVEPVDFRELQEILPEELIGWPQVEKEGQRSGVAGLTVSTASALYRPDDESVSTIEVELIDTGGLGSIATMGMAHWLSMEVDRETADGYERTIEYDGYPAYEEFERQEGDIGSANLSLVVERRFIVQLHGASVRAEDVTRAADELGLERLAKLAEQ